MELGIRDTGDTRVVHVGEARIDAAVAIQFKDQMRDLIVGGPNRVILDLSAVTFVDSSGWGHRRRDETGGRATATRTRRPDPERGQGVRPDAHGPGLYHSRQRGCRSGRACECRVSL